MLDNPNRNIKKLKNSLHSLVNTSKGTWDTGARGLSVCVEGNWRD
jgi:hypothetical protein